MAVSYDKGAANKQLRITLLVVTAFILTVIDAFCTVIGIQLGIITEGNPLMRAAMTAYPELTAAAICVGVGAILAFIYRCGAQARCTVPLMIVLCVVKLAVAGMHLGWIFNF